MNRSLYIDLATAADDAAIRRLLGQTPMPGRVAVTFEREPDYFAGCATMGRCCQVLVARRASGGGPLEPDSEPQAGGPEDTSDDPIVGLACRSTRRMFVDGRPVEVGYLGQLRVAPRFHGRWLVSRGFRFLRQLDADRPVALYLAAITDENRIARGLLTGQRRRRHFPAFQEASRLCTLSLILRRPKAPIRLMGCEVGRGTREDLPAIIAFLNRQGAAKQFFPVYTEEDFENRAATPGFDPADFIIARRQGKIAGVIGLWDQSSFKQTVVRSYSGFLRVAKPLYDLSAGLLGAQPLPPVDGRIRYAYASFICVEDNDPAVFRVLLRQLYNLAAGRGYAMLMVGLSAPDPLLPVARAYAHIAYHSTLYAVRWENEGEVYGSLKSLVPYVEIAAL